MNSGVSTASEQQLNPESVTPERRTAPLWSHGFSLMLSESSKR
jgi:hypothetical protein